MRALLDLDKIKWHQIMESLEHETFASEPERQERRRTVQAALKSLMPWNDADFSRINVRSICPCECRTAEEWEQMLEQNLGATVRVCIGTATFWCIPQLLRMHSSYFSQELRTENNFQAGQELWPTGFRAAYDWMRLQAPLDEGSPPARIVELLHTAQQLGMDTLELLCHSYLCTDRFREKAAYEVYLRARPYPEFHSLRQLMLQRIGFHFLALVGSYEYLEMPADDLQTMLQEDSLGVNSEVEVLYGLMRWMATDTAKRAKLLPRLLRCVRFTRVPLSLLCRFRRALEKREKQGGDRDQNQDHIAANLMLNAMRESKELVQRIRDAISVLMLRRVCPKRRDFRAACREKGFVVEAPREWLYDESCPYHIAQPLAPYRHRVGSGQFLVYVMRRAQSALHPAKEFPNLRAVIPAEEDDLDSIEDLLSEEEQAAAEAEAEPPRNLVGLPVPYTVPIMVPRMDSDSEPEEELCDHDEAADQESSDEGELTLVANLPILMNRAPAPENEANENAEPEAKADQEPGSGQQAIPGGMNSNNNSDESRPRGLPRLPLLGLGDEELAPNIFRNLANNNYPNADTFMDYLDIVDGIGGFNNQNFLNNDYNEFFPQYYGAEELVISEPEAMQDPPVDESEGVRPFEAYINETEQVIQKLLDEINEREKAQTE